MRFIIVLMFSIYVSVFSVFGQKQIVNTCRTDENISIDGSLSESIWGKTPVSTGFVTYQPTNGQKTGFESFVRVVYDDRALYVAAFLKDNKPDSIYRELTVRDDDNGNADMFCLNLNPNNDGQNSYMFWVTAANVQTDIRVSTFDSDYSWDAVWESGVQVSDSGWCVEIKIPYSAIRFPNNSDQVWGINFFRSVRRVRETSSFNLVDKKKGTKTEQMAEMIGISGIQAPLRLSFTPYLATYLNHYSEIGKPAYAFSGGVDMKLGLNESYTLDMTLIPDFGQEKSDNIVLNLSPYETYYEERRPFFTEGTELFNKCGLFYSRRIGKQPDGYYLVDTLKDYDYDIIRNPNQSRLINAFKITGRNKNNLAIGVFNAITGNTFATVKNPDGEREKIRTEPWANYNLFVIDKAFNKNTYLNFTNAFVLRPDQKFYSNVTGSSFKIMDKKNVFGIRGNAVWSYVKSGDDAHPANGYQSSVSIGKLTGTINFSYNLDVLSDTYNPNVMGYLQQNNGISQYLSFAYNIYEPLGKFNSILTEVYLDYSRIYNPNTFTRTHLHIWNYALTKKHLSIWNNLHFDLYDKFDYFEPRVKGRYYRAPAIFYENLYFSTDYRKTFAIDLDAQFTTDAKQYKAYSCEISPRWRINKHLVAIYSFEISYDHNDYGYVENTETNVFFGKRDISIITNSLSVNWVFTNKIYLQLIARHYWSKVNYNSFHLLSEDGTLADTEITFADKNINFNAFNIDLVFSWNFAPGSFLNIVYKNNIYNMEYFSQNNIFPNYRENFINMMQQPQWNSVSLKLIYYVDWQNLKRK